MVKTKKIKYFKQKTNYTCGPACMRMVLSAFGIKKSERELSDILKTNKKTGTSYKKLKKVAKKFNLQCIEKSNSDINKLNNLKNENFIIIVGYYLEDDKEEHYAVLKRITKSKIYLLDPEKGKNHNLSIDYFNKVWRATPKLKRWFIALRK